MTIKFKTTSGSVYELDSKNNQIRRIQGLLDPTPRQGPDGQWKKYKGITPVEKGKNLIITWNIDHDCPEYSGLSALRTTMTSPIEDIFFSC